jgi:hypothetical protein
MSSVGVEYSSFVFALIGGVPVIKPLAFLKIQSRDCVDC